MPARCFAWKVLVKKGNLYGLMGTILSDPCIAELPDKSSQISEHQPPLNKLYRAVHRGVHNRCL
eukprot:365765-Chlamydomonas_euryale.AAC.4